MMLFVDFGFSIAGTKIIAINNSDANQTVTNFWAIWIIQAAIFSISIIGVLFSIQYISFLNFYRHGILIACLSVLGFLLTPNWFFQGIDKVKILSTITVASKLITFPLFFLFINSSTDHRMALFLHSMSFMFAGISSVVLIFSKSAFRIFNFRLLTIGNLKSILSQSWPIFLSNSAITLMTSGFTVVLGYYTTSFYVALYGAFDRMIQAFSFSIFVPVNQAFFPILSRLSQNDISRAKKIFKLLFSVLALVMIIFYLFILKFEDYIILNLFSKYGNIRLLFRVVSISILPITLGAVCGQLGLVAIGGESQKNIYSKVYIYTALILVPLSIVLGFYFKLNGVIFCMIFSQVVIFVAMYYFVTKSRILSFA